MNEAVINRLLVYTARSDGDADIMFPGVFRLSLANFLFERITPVAYYFGIR